MEEIIKNMKKLRAEYEKKLTELTTKTENKIDNDKFMKHENYIEESFVQFRKKIMQITITKDMEGKIKRMGSVVPISEEDFEQFRIDKVEKQSTVVENTPIKIVPEEPKEKTEAKRKFKEMQLSHFSQNQIDMTVEKLDDPSVKTTKELTADIDMLLAKIVKLENAQPQKQAFSFDEFEGQNKEIWVKINEIF